MREVHIGGMKDFLKRVVCYTAVFSVVTQRFSPPLWAGALRNETKTGCVADYETRWRAAISEFAFRIIWRIRRSRRVFCQITPKKFLVLKEALKTCSYVKLVFDSASSASLGEKGSVKGD